MGGHVGAHPLNDFFLELRNERKQPIDNLPIAVGRTISSASAVCSSMCSICSICHATLVAAPALSIFLVLECRMMGWKGIEARMYGGGKAARKSTIDCPIFSESV